MSGLFSSTRERRLWLWTLLLVVTIYSTLGLTAQLAGIVDKNLQAAGFLVCLILVGLSVLTQGLRVRPGGKEIGLMLGIIAVYGMLGVRMAITERSHLVEYGVLAVLVSEAIHERVKNGRPVPVPQVLALLVTSLLGFFDECLQGILPSRYFAWEDVLFNVLAALVAVVGLELLRRVRKRNVNDV